jgi:3-hydroxyisobutyrate dehydrogenase
VAAAEALLVGGAFGLDQNVMLDVLNDSTGKNYTTEHKARQFMLAGRFDYGFGLALRAKDVRTAAELGESLGWEMRMGQLTSRSGLMPKPRSGPEPTTPRCTATCKATERSAD